jgi:hypothetical protein
MNDQNGSVGRGTGVRRHRASSPAGCTTHESGAHNTDTETIVEPLERLPRTKRPSPSFARVLGGLVPAVPVFIPAKQICQERSQRDAKSESKERSFGATDAGLLTAELLNRRWLQGEAS